MYFSGSGQQTATIATANQGILESVKKCKNFLSTLLKLASQSNQSPQTIRNVNELIQGLVVSNCFVLIFLFCHNFSDHVSKCLFALAAALQY